MFGALSVFFWCLQFNAVGAELATPQNPTMRTLNTNYTLSWDWDQSVPESVTFTTQYVAKYQLKFKKRSPNWSMACDNMQHRSCDLTAFNLHYLGIYVLRVRANTEECHSHWVQKEFCPDTDASVGPPTNVELSPSGSDLDLLFWDPVTSTNSSMKEFLPKLYYHILYWEHSEDTQALRNQSVNSSANLVTLPNTKAWTWYCVSIQSRSDFYNKSSRFTSPYCRQTQGATPWWQIFVYFLGSLVLCFLLVLFSLYSFFWFYKTLKATFYPSIQLPQYLCDSPGSDIPQLLCPDPQCEPLCDKVSLCPAPLQAPLEPLADLEPDCRHSCQDSGGSRDSGVYSTGSAAHLEQLNMSNMKSPLLSRDQGLTDMSV